MLNEEINTIARNISEYINNKVEPMITIVLTPNNYIVHSPKMFNVN